MNTATGRNPRKYRVLVADDHVLVREGIRKVLGFDDELVVVDEAANGEEVLSRLNRGGIDLLLLDLLMPGVSDVDLIRKVLASRPELPVLVLTMHADSHIARRALEAGALGYLTKDSSSELLLEAIRHVLAGRSFIDPSLSEALLLAERLAREPLEQLSARERQVLVALVKGRSVLQIAHELKLAANTVSTYKGRLMEKLEQTSLSDLVRYALRRGLVE